VLMRRMTIHITRTNPIPFKVEIEDQPFEMSDDRFYFGLFGKNKKQLIDEFLRVKECEQ
jgi:hypothetical protein